MITHLVKNTPCDVEILHTGMNVKASRASAAAALLSRSLPKMGMWDVYPSAEQRGCYRCYVVIFLWNGCCLLAVSICRFILWLDDLQVLLLLCRHIGCNMLQFQEEAA